MSEMMQEEQVVPDNEADVYEHIRILHERAAHAGRHFPPKTAAFFCS